MIQIPKVIVFIVYFISQVFSTSFDHNKAGSEGKEKRGFGGVLFVERPQTDIVIQNCSFYLNAADKNGNDLYLRKVSKLRIANCILASELSSKSRSIWSSIGVALNFWNILFLIENSTIINSRNVQEQPLGNVTRNWDRLGEITETPYASGKCLWIAAKKRIRQNCRAPLHYTGHGIQLSLIVLPYDLRVVCP